MTKRRKWSLRHYIQTATPLEILSQYVSWRKSGLKYAEYDEPEDYPSRLWDYRFALLYGRRYFKEDSREIKEVKEYIKFYKDKINNAK